MTPANKHYAVPSYPSHAPLTHSMTRRHTWGTRKRAPPPPQALRHFRRNAHQRGKNFFQSLRMWLLTAFRTTSPQPYRRICTAAPPPFFW